MRQDGTSPMDRVAGRMLGRLGGRGAEGEVPSRGWARALAREERPVATGSARDALLDRVEERLAAQEPVVQSPWLDFDVRAMAGISAYDPDALTWLDISELEEDVVWEESVARPRVVVGSAFGPRRDRPRMAATARSRSKTTARAPSGAAARRPSGRPAGPSPLQRASRRGAEPASTGRRERLLTALEVVEHLGVSDRARVEARLDAAPPPSWLRREVGHAVAPDAPSRRALRNMPDAPMPRAPRVSRPAATSAPQGRTRRTARIAGTAQASRGRASSADGGGADGPGRARATVGLTETLEPGRAARFVAPVDETAADVDVVMEPGSPVAPPKVKVAPSDLAASRADRADARVARAESAGPGERAVRGRAEAEVVRALPGVGETVLLQPAVEADEAPADGDGFEGARVVRSSRPTAPAASRSGVRSGAKGPAQAASRRVVRPAAMRGPSVRATGAPRGFTASLSPVRSAPSARRWAAQGPVARAEGRRAGVVTPTAWARADREREAGAIAASPVRRTRSVSVAGSLRPDAVGRAAADGVPRVRRARSVGESPPPSVVRERASGNAEAAVAGSRPTRRLWERAVAASAEAEDGTASVVMSERSVGGRRAVVAETEGPRGPRGLRGDEPGVARSVAAPGMSLLLAPDDVVSDEEVPEVDGVVVPVRTSRPVVPMAAPLRRAGRAERGVQAAAVVDGAGAPRSWAVPAAGAAAAARAGQPPAERAARRAAVSVAEPGAARRIPGPSGVVDAAEPEASERVRLAASAAAAAVLSPTLLAPPVAAAVSVAGGAEESPPAAPVRRAARRGVVGAAVARGLGRVDAAGAPPSSVALQVASRGPAWRQLVRGRRVGVPGTSEAVAPFTPRGVSSAGVADEAASAFVAEGSAGARPGPARPAAGRPLARATGRLLGEASAVGGTLGALIAGEPVTRMLAAAADGDVISVGEPDAGGLVGPGAAGMPAAAWTAAVREQGAFAGYGRRRAAEPTADVDLAWLGGRTGAPASVLLAAPTPEAEAEAEVAGWVRRGGARTALGMTPAGAADASDGGASTVASGGPRAARRLVGLVRALERSRHGEGLVQTLLDSPDDAELLAELLPDAASRIVREVVEMRTLADDAAQVLSAPVQGNAPSGAPMRGGAVSVRRPDAPTARGVNPSRTRAAGGARSSAETSQGQGRLMRLSQQLMSLIHLAEDEKRAAEAARSVRRSEEKVESPSGPAAPQSDEHDGVTLASLQREVLEAVQRELELMRERGEGGRHGDFGW